MMRESKPDLDLLKQVWLQEIGSTQWIERKEIAAWTALALYLLGLSYIFKILYDYENRIGNYLIWTIIVGLILLGYVVFSFIQSQYSISYARRAYQTGIKSVLYKIIGKEEINFDFVQGKLNPTELQEHIDDAREMAQPLKDALYPLQNVVSLCFNIPLNLLLKTINRIKKRKFPTRPELGSFEKGEAAIYTSMLLSNAVLILYLIWREWPWYVSECLWTYLGILLIAVGIAVPLAIWKQRKS